MCDAVLEKPVSVTAGKDDFEAILMASHRSIGNRNSALPCPTLHYSALLFYTLFYLACRTLLYSTQLCFLYCTMFNSSLPRNR